jgi:dTDP-4-amino-4,6-dideoxygalactose transaminase
MKRTIQQQAGSQAPRAPTSDPAAPPGAPLARRQAGERFEVSAGPNGGPPPGQALTPPVGFPLARGDVVHSLATALAKGRATHLLGRILADRLGVKWANTVSSGRAALATILTLLHQRHPARDEVVLPAFGCFSLASAVVRANLRLRLVDLAPGGFDCNPDQLSELAGPRSLALIAAHLLGYPVDLEPLQSAATRVGAVLIDDAAQALGARRRGQAAGGGGAVGILSFGRGKPLTALGGGAIICSDPQLVAPLEQATKQLPGAPLARTALLALEAALYSPLLDPRIYWLPERLPLLRVGATEYDPGFSIRRLDGFRIGLIMRGLARLEVVNEARRRGAERLRLALAGVSGLELISPPPASHTIYLRFPVVMPSEKLRARAQTELRRAGIGASRLYPAPLSAIPALAGRSPDLERDFPEANRLAGRLLCLPTYPHCDEGLVEKSAAILRRILAGQASGAASAAD